MVKSEQRTFVKEGMLSSFTIVMSDMLIWNQNSYELFVHLLEKLDNYINKMVMLIYVASE